MYIHISDERIYLLIFIINVFEAICVTILSPFEKKIILGIDLFFGKINWYWGDAHVHLLFEKEWVSLFHQFSCEGLKLLMLKTSLMQGF